MRGKSRGGNGDAHKVSADANIVDDALSLEALDQVVGGAGSTNQEEQHHEETPYVPPPVTHEAGYTEGEGGYHPPSPPPPPPPPPPAVDPAVTHIAEHLTATDPHSLYNAGESIFALIQNGTRPEDAMLSIHDAVTLDHALTGEQAIGLLAGIYSHSSGDTPTDVYREINALIDGGQVTVDHAMTALAAGTAGTDPDALSSITNLMSSLGWQYGVTGTQMLADVDSAITSSGMSGNDAVSLLLATSNFDWQHSLPHIGTEIGQLVHDGRVTADDVIADMNSGIAHYSFSAQFAIPVLAAAAEASDAMTLAAGQEIAELYPNSNSLNYVMSQIDSAVAANTISGEHAIGVLTGFVLAAGNNATYGYGEMDQLINNGKVSASDAVGEIHHLVTSDMLTAEQGITLFAQIAMGQPYSMSAAAFVEIGALVSSGDINATDAISIINSDLAAHTLTGDQAFLALLSIGARDASLLPTIEPMLDSLIANGQLAAYQPASLLIQRMGSGNAALDNLLFSEFERLVDSNIVSVSDATTQLTGLAHWGWSNPQHAYDGLAWLIADHGVSASAVFSAIITPGISWNGYAYSPVQDAAGLAAAHPELIPALAPQIVALIGPNFGETIAINAIGALVTSHHITADQAIGIELAVMTAAGTAAMTSAVSASIAGLITGNQITTVQAMADIHSAVTGLTLNVDTAIRLLASVTAGVGAAAQGALNSELTALVSAHLVTVAHAIDVLSALSQTASPALHDAIVGAISALDPSQDPAQVLFLALPDNPTAAQLADLAGQLNTLLGQHTISIENVLADIDSAVGSHQLTGAQAVAVLASLAAHGDTALQDAVGGEVAALIAHHGVGSPAISSAFGALITSGAMTSAQVVEVLLAAEIKQGLTASEAHAVVATAGDAFFMMQSSSSIRLNTRSLIDGISGMLAAHTMTGAQAIAALSPFIPTNTGNLWATIQVESWINGGTISFADMDAAVTAGWWPINDAVTSLGHFANSGDPTLRVAAIAEVNALISAGTLDVGRLLDSIHNQLFPYGYVPPEIAWSVDQAVAFGVAMSVTHPEMQDSLARDFATLLAGGRLGGAQFGVDLSGLISAQIMTVDQAVAMLVKVTTYTAPGNTAVNDAILGFFTAHLLTMEQVIAIAPTLHHDGQALLNGLGSSFVDLVNNGQITVDQIAQFDRFGLASGQMASLLTGLIAHGNAAQQPAAQAELFALIGNGHIAAADAMTALDGGVRTGALTGDRAMSLLIGLEAGGASAALHAAIIGELNALTAGRNHLTFAQAIAGIDAAFTSHTLSSDQTAHLLAGLVVSSGRLEVAASREMEKLAANGQIPASTFVAEIKAATSGDATINMLVQIANNGPTLLGAACAEIVSMLQHSTASTYQVTTDIEALVSSGDITMNRAIGLFATIAQDLAPGSMIYIAGSIPAFQAMVQEMHSLADRGLATQSQIIDMIGKSGAFNLLYAFSVSYDSFHSDAINEVVAQARAGRLDWTQALTGVSAFNDLSHFDAFIPFINSGPPSVLTALADRFVWSTTTTIDTVLGNINGAWSSHTLSADRAYMLLADIGGNPTGPRADQQAHQQMQLMVNAGAITGVHAIELLQQLTSQTTDSTTQWFFHLETEALLQSVQVLVDAGARGIGISAADAVSRLMQEYYASQVSVSTVSNAIAAGVASHDLTPAQGVDFLLRFVGAGTVFAFAPNVVSSGLSAWFSGPAEAFASMAQNGLTGTMLDRALDRAIASGLMNVDQAVTTLAAAATVSGLQQGAATELASLVQQRLISADQATADFLRGFGAAPMFDPSLALATLAMACSARGAPADMDDGVGAAIAQWARWNISSAVLTNDIAALVNAHTITPDQAFSLLVPIAAHGNTDLQGCVGHVLGTMLANGQITNADIHRAIATHALPADAAVVVLAGMTEQGSATATNAALGQLTWMISSNLVSADQAVADISNATHPYGTQASRGITGPQAVAALFAIGTPAAAQAMPLAGLLFANSTGFNGPVEVMVDVAGHLPANMQAAAFQLMVNISLSNGAALHIPEAIDAAVNAQTLTARQAATLLAGVIGTSGAGDYLGRPCMNEIAALVSHGQITAAAAVAMIDNAVENHTLSANKAITAMAVAVAALAPAEKAFEVAMGKEIAALIAGNLISTSQAMTDIDTAVASGAFSAHQAVMTLAALTVADATQRSAVVTEIAALVSEGRFSAPEAINDIRAALTAKIVNTDQALSLMVDVSVAAGGGAAAAAGETISAMVAARQTTAAHAIDVVLGFAGQSASGYQATAGATLASLVAHSQLTPAQAIQRIDAAVTAHTLTADQSVGLLANLALAGDAAQTAVAGELSHLITTGKLNADQAVVLLMGAAMTGGAGVQGAVGAEIAALVAAGRITVAQAMADVGTAAGNAVVQAFNVLIAMSAKGDAALQIAAGKECADLVTRDPIHMIDLMASIGNAVGSHQLTADQAVDILTGAISAGSQTGAQTLAAAQIQALVAHGQIEAAQVMADIQNAVVSGALPVDQALEALLVLGAGASAALNQAAADEVSNLVIAGQVTAADAANILLQAGGPSYLPVTFDYDGTAATMATLNRVGIMLNNLVDHGLLSAHDAAAAVVAGIGNTIGFENAVHLLFCMSANGTDSTAAAVGAVVADMLASNINSSRNANEIVIIIDHAIVTHAMQPAAAVVFMANILAGNPPPPTIGSSAFAAFAAEAAALCNRHLGFDAYGLMNAAIGAAAANPNAAVGAGAMLGAVWTNVMYYNGGDYVWGDEIIRAIDGAVGNASLTVDEGILITAGLRLGGRDMGIVDGVTEILSLISSGKTTFTHAVDVLATAAGHAASDVQPGLSSELFSLAHHSPPDGLVQAMAEIGTLVSSNAITGMQAVGVMTALAAAGDTAAQLAAGKQMALLVAAGQVTGDQLTQFVESNIRAHDTAGASDNHQHLAVDQAMVVMLGMMISSDASARSVGAGEIAQQITWNTITAADAIAMIHGAMTAQQITVDQELTALVGLATVDVYGLVPMQGPVTTEINALVSGHIVTADHAIAVLLAAAHTGAGYAPTAVGGEIAALIGANLISATQAIADIHSAVTSQNLTADQAVVVLAAIASNTTSIATQEATVTEMGALIASGAITAERVMADIVNAATDPYAVTGGAPRMTPSQALYLLSMQMDGTPAQQHAAAAQIASVIDNGRWGGTGFNTFYSAMDSARIGGAITMDQMFTLLVDVGAHASPGLLAQCEMNFRSMIYGHTIAPAHGFELMVGLAGDGTAATAVFIGREIAHLATQYGVWATVTDAMAGINAALNSHHPYGASSSTIADNTVIVLATMSANGIGRSDIVHELISMANGNITVASMMTDIGRAIDAGAFSADQAVSVLIDLYDAWPYYSNSSGALVVQELGTMIASGQITLSQMIADLHAAEVSGQLPYLREVRMLAGLAIDTRIDAVAACADEIAAVTLAQWNVTPANPAYASMLAGLQLVTTEMTHNDPSAAIAHLTAFANANHLPADALLTTLFVEWDGLTAVVPSAQAARDQVSDLIKTHLGSFDTERTLADAVQSGAYSADVAAAMVSEIVTSYFGTFYQLPFGFANVAHQVTAAVDVLHVEIAIAHDTPLVLAGQMTGADAVAHVLSAAGNTGFAAELGLADLATKTANPQFPADYLHPEMSGMTPQEMRAVEAAHAAAVAASHDILQFIADRIAVGTTATALAAADISYMTSNAVIALLQYEARAGRTGDNADLIEDIALAALMEHTSSNSGVGWTLAHNDAFVGKMITGASALMGLDMVHFDVHMKTVQMLYGAHLTNTVGSTSGHLTEAQAKAVDDANSQSTDCFTKAWWFLRDSNAVVNAFGHAGSLTGSGSSSMAEGWVRFGATFATQGLPLQGALTGLRSIQESTINNLVMNLSESTTLATDFAGNVTTVDAPVIYDTVTVAPPEWMMEAIGNYAPEILDDGVAVNITPAMVFTAVSITAKVLPILLAQGAVADFIGKNTTEGLTGACGMISAGCDLITNTLTGAVTTYAMDAYHVLASEVQVYKDIGMLMGGTGSVGQLTEHAQAYGENLFSFMFVGTDVHAFGEVAVSTGQLMVDLFTGNTDVLQMDAYALGTSLGDLVTSNHYVQMLVGNVEKFADAMADAATMAFDAYMNALSDLIDSPVGAFIIDNIIVPIFGGPTYEEWKAETNQTVSGEMRNLIQY